VNFGVLIMNHEMHVE